MDKKRERERSAGQWRGLARRALACIRRLVQLVCLLAPEQQEATPAGRGSKLNWAAAQAHTTCWRRPGGFSGQTRRLET